MDAPVDHSRELGRRMLQGWAMLADTCPHDGCAVPLLRSPDRTHTFCVNCRRESRLGPPPQNDSRNIDVTSTSAGAQVSANGASSSPSRPQGNVLGTLRPFLGGRASPSRPVNGPTQEASRNSTLAPYSHSSSSPQRVHTNGPVPTNGPVLMNGYHSPGDDVDSPLSDVSRGSRMREEQGPSVALTSAGSQEGGQGFGPAPRFRVLESDASPAQLGVPAGAGSDSWQAEGTGVSGEGAVRRLVAPANPVSQKLLEGWTMLGEFCPACYNPIMRSRTGVQCCVVCPEAQGAGLSITETTPAGPDTVANSVAEQQGGEEEDGKLPTEPLAPSQVQQGSLEHAPRGSISVVAGLDPAAVFKGVHKTLVRKLQDLRAEVEQTSDIVRLGEVLRAVTECSAAIKSIKAIM